MARPLRLKFPGAVYHATSRGNSKQDIFLDEKNRKLFRKVPSSVVAGFRMLCHAYCLVGHDHLIVENLE